MKHNFIALAFVVAGGLLVAGCDITTPSQVQMQKIQIKESMKTEVMDAYRVDENRLSVLAASWQRNGEGPLNLLMTYTDGKKPEIERQARKYKKALIQNGVKPVSVDLIEVADMKQHGRVIVSYRSVHAQAPEHCQNLPGYHGAETLANANSYKFGCESQMAISKMIADPKDLMGRGGTPDGDSRRLGTIIEGHMSGTPNEAMEGISASTIGGGE